MARYCARSHTRGPSTYRHAGRWNGPKSDKDHEVVARGAADLDEPAHSGTPHVRPSTVASPRRGLAVYLTLVALGSGACEWALLRTGGPITQHQGLVLLLMWLPGLASIATRVALREGFRDVSFRPGGRPAARAAALAWAYPLAVGFLAYGLAWLTGLAEFAARPMRMFGLAPEGAAARFALRLGFMATVGVPLAAINAAGEELGWRGYMLTRLVDARVPRPVLVSGLIWGLRHLPLILSGQYAAGPYPALSALMFMVSIVPAAYVHAYVRLASGSVWPAVVAHSAWNAVIQGAFDAATRG